MQQKPIDELAFEDRFVRTLPGDARTDTRTREVLAACYSRVQPTPVGSPELLAVVPEVAALLGLDPAPTPELAAVLAGNRTVPGMRPYAACYGGHQFGSWAGQLGDGRAITLGEVTHDGQTWELQLKGAGPTPYSRRADGRAVLRSSLRELVCSEAMHHLGVPTTRALSLALTGENVMRDLLYDGHPAFEPGAVVCRVAPTFLRFGNFEIHTARDDHRTLRTLVDFTRERFFAGAPVEDMFDEVMRRTAWMVAEWMRVGFVHGVMNTDNMSILGLTVDYGPYGWLEPFDPDWTPNITDAGGRRYRFGNQPAVAHWNLAQLARALGPVADREQIRASLDAFPGEFSAHYRATMLRKLGLHGSHGGDDALLAELAELMGHVETDYPLLFRRLATEHPTLEAIRDAFYEDPDRARVEAWLERYRGRDRDVAGMLAINPLYVPRNYVVQQVIEATDRGDRDALPELLEVLRHPYTEQPGKERFAAKRPEWARVKPGCSMLSCSS